MGGSMSSLCMCFSQGSRYRDDDEWEPRYMRKIRPSDDDRGYWVGDPNIDEKASDFIAKFHDERQAFAA